MFNKKRITLIVAWMALIATFLVACGGAGESGGPDLFAQNSNAQVTRNAVDTQIAYTGNLLTATAQAPTVKAQETQFALGVTQTVDAMNRLNGDATATAGAAQTGTSAYFVGMTATIQVSATAAAAANAIATQTAIPLQTQTALEFQSKIETNRVNTWAPWLLGSIVVALIAAFLVFTYIKLMPRVDGLLQAAELRLRTFYSKDGTPNFVVPEKDALTAISTNRMLNPALHVRPGQNAIGSGGAKDERLQNLLTARAQAAVVAANLHRPASQQVLAALAGANGELLESETEPVGGSPVREARDEGDVAMWVTEVEGKLIEGTP